MPGQLYIMSVVSFDMGHLLWTRNMNSCTYQSDAAFCFQCARDEQEGKLRFTANNNLKKTLESNKRKDAVQAMVVLPATTQNFGDLLHAKVK